MTNPLNNDHESTLTNADNQQTEDKNSSEVGRAYGWSEPKDHVDENEVDVSGSAVGDVSENHQRGDNGLASDAMGSGSGSDLMRSYNSDDDRNTDNESVIDRR